MNHYHFKALLQNEGWLSPAFVSTDTSGLITYISNQPKGNVRYEQVDGYALPGFQNAHSHAFQYAMAGIAETHQTGAVADDFWSWREAMYKVALTISPDQLEAIATMLYCEMVKHGYTQVAEFHYLHHGKDGAPYANLAEMGERLVSAAQTAGIKITLVPMFYQKGGFGIAPQSHQRRFISSTIDDIISFSKQPKRSLRLIAMPIMDSGFILFAQWHHRISSVHWEVLTVIFRSIFIFPSNSKRSEMR